ncbi:MAG: 4Fe-4S binding protein, partial [Victivallaceae bacterium]
ILSFCGLGIVLLLTLIFGRLYCSFLCPLGILQDIFSFFSRILFHRRKYFYQEQKNYQKIRYSVLAGLIIMLLLGVMLPMAMVEPFSAFGRICFNICKPVYIWSNNLLYSTGKFDNLNPMNYPPFSAFALSVSAVFFIFIGVLAVLRGRLFCNTICPAGALLGLISRVSWLRLQLDAEKCVKCGMCVKRCKSGCISLDEKKLDFERCVMCLDCVSACKFSSIKPVAVKFKDRKQADATRRDFMISLGGAAVGAIILPPLLKSSFKPAKIPIMPPGALALDRFNSKCTACHLCVSACPGKVLKPAGLEYGLAGMLQPRLDFKAGMCEYECAECSNICPTGALMPLTLERKKTLRIGMVQYNQRICVVQTDKTHCGACAEHCPTTAVHMEPWEDGLTIPRISPELCIGCGCCENICPVLPVKAITVSGVKIQEQVKSPT